MHPIRAGCICREAFVGVDSVLSLLQGEDVFWWFWWMLRTAGKLSMPAASYSLLYKRATIIPLFIQKRQPVTKSQFDTCDLLLPASKSPFNYL